MIKVPYLQISIKRDMSTTATHVVPPHELALLMVREEGNVEILKTLKKVTRKVDPREEYNRLKRMWGANKETKIPWVEVAFGRFETGVFNETMKKGAKHYLPKKKIKATTTLTPQQKAAKTRAANKLIKENEEIPISATN